MAKGPIIGLIAVGEREPGTQRLSESGRSYIKEVCEGLAHNFTRIYYAAPSQLAKETFYAYLKSFEDLAWKRNLTVSPCPEIHTNRMEEWVRLLGGLGGGKKPKNFAELIEAEEKAGVKGLLLAEGERLFGFIESVANELTADDRVIFFMHQPFPETVLLWLMETRGHPVLREIKPLSEFPMLSPLDNIELEYSQKDGAHPVLESVDVNRHLGAVLEQRKRKALMK